ncbi:Espin [Acanthosepion pharaonis]|uniref:Espin n=1 Tax=Acanthosepion pharaonis TaxID=158019 RepID=A0A812CAZ8_ACAPH|nr:Espin [Sepia pharaonis]
MNNGATPSYLASQECKLDILKYLVTEAKGSLKITAFDGMSCLHAAAQMGHLDIITWLVQEAHCNPNERDFDGATPLHFAASCGQTKVVEWLLQVGECNITVDRTGATPLHNAAEIGQLQVFSFSLCLFHMSIDLNSQFKRNIRTPSPHTQSTSSLPPPNLILTFLTYFAPDPNPRLPKHRKVLSLLAWRFQLLMPAGKGVCDTCLSLPL